VNALRKLFGPSRNDIWKQLCDRTGAQFVDGGFWKGDKVEASHGEWTITLDTFTVSTGKTSTTYTRMRAPFVNPDQFRFTIYRKGFFSDIAKWLGMQDIEVGHPRFDEDFIIKGTHREKLVALFDNPQLRELIDAQPTLHFTVRGGGWFGNRFPPPCDELSFVVRGVIKDVDRLKLLFDLFATTLDQLCRIGAAYENGPNLTE
jgi:hypothetical protein